MKGLDGVTRTLPSTTGAQDGDEVCDFCGGHHDGWCPAEHEFARQVKAAAERIFGKPKRWGRGNTTSTTGRNAAAYRARGRTMTPPSA